MSKYLRLTSVNNLGKVETNFNEDIRIDEDSKIALLNASFSVNDASFTVNSRNDTITYKSISTGAGNPSTIALTKRTYNRTTASDFIDDIELQLNNQQVENSQNIGNQFQVQQSSNGKVEIQSNISPNSAQLVNAFLNAPLGVNRGTAEASISGNDIRLRNSGTSVADHRNYVASFSPIGKGISALRLKINNLQNNAGSEASNGFIMGFSKKNPKDWVLNNNILSVSDFGYCIEVGDPALAGDNGAIRFRNGFSNTNTFTNSAGNLVLDKTGNNARADANSLEIIYVNGKIQVRLYRASQGAGTFENIAGINTEFEVAEGIDLFPYCVVKGSAAIMNLTNFRFYLDPYKSDLTPYLNSLEHQEDGLVGATPIQVRNRGASRSLEFASLELANELGFNEVNLPNVARTQGEFRAEADNLFDALIQNPYFIIRMLNMELESYDGSQGGRFNVVSSFGDNSQNTQNSVFYEASNPIFLKISNRTARTIRNMKCQILNADLSPVSTDGSISLVFLVQ